MDSSTEESDSRTAAFSRKRKQPSSLNFERYASDSADKRLRLNNDDDEQDNRRSSAGSVEDFTSISGIRRDSGTVTEDSEVVDLDHGRASKFGWNPVNGSANGDVSESPNSPRQDPFTIPNVDHGPASYIGWAPINGNAHRNLGGSFQSPHQDPCTNSYQQQPARRMSLDDVATMRISDGPADNVTTTRMSGSAADTVFRKMEAKQSLRPADYEMLAQFLYQNDSGLTVHAIQHAGLKAAILGVLHSRVLDENAPIAGILGAAAHRGDYSPNARSFLMERSQLVRSSPGTSLDTVAPMSISGSPVDDIFYQMERSRALNKPDYTVLAQYLDNQDAGLTVHDMKKSGLKTRVLGMLRAEGLDQNANITPILGTISQGGDFSKHARKFLQERSKLVQSFQTGLSGDVSARSGTTEHLTNSVPQAHGNAEEPLRRSFGLVNLDDIKEHSQNLNKTMKKKFSKQSRRESLEESLRSMVVHKDASFRKATTFLTQFYNKSQNISGERYSILRGHAQESLSIMQLRDAMANTTGFLRPLTSKDIADMAPKGVLSVPVTKSMNESQDLSLAQAILQEVSNGTAVARPAKNFLQTFVKVNFVGGVDDASIHSREGLDKLTESVSYIDAPSSVVQKMSTSGAATLTLEELENLLPKPKRRGNEKLALRRSTNLRYIRVISKKPNHPTNQLLAWNLLRAIKDDTAPPNARAYLEGFVYALQWGGDDYGDISEDLDPDIEIDNLIEEASMHGALPSQPQLLAQTRPLPSMDDRDSRAPHPYPSKPTYDYEKVTRIATAGTDGLDAGIANSFPPKPSYDYGELARIAASGTNDAIAFVADPNSVRLFEIPDAEQVLQRRYFHITDSEAFVRCLCCGKEGHMEESCPSRTCAHCGALDEHFSGACPDNQHCGRCRQRGHTTAGCTALSSSLMPGLNSTCDTCGRDHVEEECSELWRNGIGDDATIVQVPQQDMRVCCYNCGASGIFAHWGDDCPNFSAYDRSVKSLNTMWSKKSVAKFVLSTSLDTPRSGTGRQSVPSYQLAMLNDM